MHILEIVSFLPPYGGYFAIEQAAALQEAGNKVGMLYCQQLGLSIDHLHYFTAPYNRWTWTAHHKGQDIKVHQTNFRGLPKTIKHNVERYCQLINRMFDEYVKQYGKPDILHAQAAKWAGVVATQISERTGIPYFVTEHFSKGSYEMAFGQGWQHDHWAKELIRQCYEKARRVIPVAKELVADTACYFGDNYLHHAISNITDTDFYAYKERPKRDGRPFRFCCLGIANKGEFYRKGYDVLAKAFRGMDNCELHIAGRDTDSKPFKKQFEENHGGPIESNIFLHGNLNREEVRELLYESDALVLASRSEVQPLVVMEALSTGIPVVSTECVPQCERIDGAVLLAPIDDAGALREQMKKVQTIRPSRAFHEEVAALSSAKTVASQLQYLFAESQSH